MRYGQALVRPWDTRVQNRMEMTSLVLLTVIAALHTIHTTQNANGVTRSRGVDIIMTLVIFGGFIVLLIPAIMNSWLAGLSLARKAKVNIVPPFPPLFSFLSLSQLQSSAL
jgi:hypothetical protein